MPTKVTEQNVIDAINASLAKMKPKGKPIDSLDTKEMSDPEWSCNDFAPLVLDELCQILKIKPEDLESKKYKRGDKLPDSFPDKSFVNISMMGDPSSLNHNFNIYINSGTTYVIQAFVNQSVPIVGKFTNKEFITMWHALATEDWALAYAELFKADVKKALEGKKPPKLWLSEQYVTIL